MAGVYAIVNIWNGNQYIGSSIHPERRKIEHFGDLRRGKHHSVYLQRSFNKYGESAFAFRVLLYCEEKDLFYYEQSLIDLRTPAYNVYPCVDGPRGFRHSQESRRKMSEARKGRPSGNKGKRASEESKRKMREAQKNRPPISEETRRKKSESAKRRLPHSPEARAKMKEAWKHRAPASVESRRKMSESQKGRRHSEETKRKMSEAQRQCWARRREHIAEAGQ